MKQIIQRAFLLCGLLGGLFASPANAQQRVPNRGCGTTENNEAMQQQLERTIPGYNRHAMPAPMSGAQLRQTSQNYTIPIVFHVVHNGEAVGTGSNISDARILEQLTRLNEDFAKLNADRTGIPSVFQPAHADVQVQFALAQRDPNGNCFSGINRISRSSKGWTAPPYSYDYCNATIKPNSFWDPSKYLNFWVVDLGGGLLGFAQFPDNTAALGGLNASGGAANTDGVVCLYSSVGNGDVSAAPYNLGRTATHEVGHWLGLRHIWGDGGCTVDDFVTDTPAQGAENYGCPTFPSRSCSTTGNGDMFMNYMDYTDDACMFMFSSGQKARVQAVMSANTPRRTSLATSSALPPAVAYDAETTTPLVCEGGSIALTGTAPTGYSYSWTGPNGFTSTQQNPVLTGVTLAAAGTYTMTVTPAGGCPVSDFVEVAVRPLSGTPTLTASATTTCSGSPVTLTATPVGSQTAAVINQTWDVGATEGGWTRDNTGTSRSRTPPVWGTNVTTPGINGTRFIKVTDVSNGNAFTGSALYSPVFSAGALSSLTLSFQHIFVASSNSSSNVNGDNGKVEISTNGGASWTALLTYTTNQGSTTTSMASPATVTFNLSTYAGQSNLQLRWQYRSGGGGSWSVDNIVASGAIANTYAWSLISGDGLPATSGSGNTLAVTPTRNSVYQVTVTAPGRCSSGGSIISIAVPTTTTWTGAAGTSNWNTGGNWNPCVPTRTMTATIPGGLATPYPTITSAIEVGTLMQHGPLTLSGGSLTLYGDHLGTGTFTQTGGTFVVAGTGTQSLRGLSYGALTIDGPGVKTLATDAAATGAVTLSRGLLATNSHKLTLNNGAFLTETPASYVLGQVSATIALSAGSSTNFRGLGAGIAVPAGSISPGSTTAVRFTGSRLTDSRRSSFQAITRYFDLTPTVNSGLNLTVTLSYNAAAELGDLVETRLTTYRAVDANAAFEQMAGTLNTASGIMTIPNVNHLSVWTLADAGSPLPVSLARFEVQPAGPDAYLDWATAAEKNNDHFAVEVSTNGRSFQAVGQVAGAGSSTQRRQYAYTDAQVARYGAPLLYYRLRQMDTDGTATYSPVRTLAVGQSSEAVLRATLWPNPSAGAGQAPSLSLQGTTTAPVTLTLRDALGRVRSVRTVAAAANDISLPEATGLPAGLYVLEVRQGARRVSLKVLRD